MKQALHYIYSNKNIVAAESIRVGSILNLANGKETMVTSVKKINDYGLYNPLTLSGNIVVDVITSASYTMNVDLLLAHSGTSVLLRSIYKYLGLHSTLRVSHFICQTGSMFASLAPSGFDMVRI